MITHKQLTLAEIFDDCQNKFDNDKYQFLSLLDETINLDEIVPVSFISHFYASTGRPRKHQLYPMLKAVESPLASKLYDRVGDAVFGAALVDSRLNGSDKEVRP